MTENAALAAALENQSDSAGPLAALIDHGVFVPVHANGSVLFVAAEDGVPALPGFVSEACCAATLPHAAGSVHCDVLRLLDIADQTRVGVLSLHSSGGWARVPVPVLNQAMRERGRDATGERMQLRPSTHVVALALRQALARRIADFPAVRAVWVSNARWIDTGMEQLMVHVAVDEPIPSPSAERLADLVMGEDVALGDQRVGTMALNTTTHAEFLAQLETLGLDPVRGAERPVKKWWRRS